MQRKAWVLFILIGVVVGGSLWYLWSRSATATPASLAGAMAHLEESSLTYAVSDAELSAAGIDRATWGRVVRDLVVPSLRGFKPYGEPTELATTTGPTFIYTMRHSDGREVPFSITITDRPSGVIAEDGIATIVFAALATRLKAGVPHPKGAEKDAFWRATIRAAEAQMKELGLPGFVRRSRETGDWTLMTWKDYAERPTPRESSVGR